MTFFNKLTIGVARLFFYRQDSVAAKDAYATNVGPTLNWWGQRIPGYAGQNVSFMYPLRLVGGVKRQVLQQFTALDSAITVGIAAAPTIVSTQTLANGSTTLVTTGITNPDIPRTIKFTGNQSAGDGTFTSASAKIVQVVGTNAFGHPISESVALNGTTAVSTIQAFATITSLLFPSRNASGDTVAVVGGASFGLLYPVQGVGDLIEISRKATAATAYTVETLPSTVTVGEAYVQSNASLAKGTVYTPYSATISFVTASLTGTLPSAPYILQILGKGGTVEDVTVTGSSSSGGVTTLTIVRNIHTSFGTTTYPSWYPNGVMLNYKAPHTITPTLTANDRLLMSYQTGVIGQ